LRDLVRKAGLITGAESDFPDDRWPGGQKKLTLTTASYRWHGWHEICAYLNGSALLSPIGDPRRNCPMGDPQRSANEIGGGDEP